MRRWLRALFGYECSVGHPHVDREAARYCDRARRAGFDIVMPADLYPPKVTR